MPQIQTIEQEEVLRLLPRRPADAHKGSCGSVVAVAGSYAYRGAAALCAEGALRGGAGLVYLAGIEPVVQLALVRTPEVCVLPCRMAKNGGIDPANAVTLREHFEGRDAVLLAGPGLAENAGPLLARLCRAPAPWRAAVLDADALNALAGARRPRLPQNTVLTPHPGEAARLLGKGWTAADVQKDRLAAVRKLADRYGCVTVLKGAGTLVSAPDGAVWRNTTGNAGLARGGSGDVLAGLLAALLAQGLGMLHAALCAVWLHGAAADSAAARRSRLAMLPHDILADLGALLAAEGF